MALHTQLPIYKVAYDLLDVAVDVTRNMPRDFKQSIGGKIRDECVELLVLIFRANVARDKVPHLDVMRERLQVAELLLGVRHYVRYVDDIVILGDLPRELNTARQQIEMFLAEHLELKLNPRKTMVQPIDQGIDFVGYLIKPWRRITRRGTVSAAHRRTVEAPLEDRRARANSYFGLMRQADGYGDRAEFARLLRRLGCSVDMRLTKVVGVPHG